MDEELESPVSRLLDEPTPHVVRFIRKLENDQFFREDAERMIDDRRDSYAETLAECGVSEDQARESIKEAEEAMIEESDMDVIPDLILRAEAQDTFLKYIWDKVQEGC